MKKTVFIGISLVLTIIIVLLLSKIIKTDYTGFKTIYPPNFNKKGISIYKLLSDTTKYESLYETFPYKEYVNNVNLTDINAININLKELNSFTNSRFLSQNILSNALTQQTKKVFTCSGLDSLNMILNWADNFKAYSNIEKTTNSFYKSIYNYWYSYAARELELIKEENTNRKYDFKFRFLAQRCANSNVYVARGNSKLEKIILYTIDGKWSYLFERFWSGTGYIFKIIVFLFVLFIFFISYQSIKIFINRKKNKY